MLVITRPGIQWNPVESSGLNFPNPNHWRYAQEVWWLWSISHQLLQLLLSWSSYCFYSMIAIAAMFNMFNINILMGNLNSAHILFSWTLSLHVFIPFTMFISYIVGTYPNQVITHLIWAGWWFQPLWKIWKSVGLIFPIYIYIYHVYNIYIYISCIIYIYISCIYDIYIYIYHVYNIYIYKSCIYMGK